MPVKLPCHLYIRVDRGLRQRLQETAASDGVSVSALARRELAAALGIKSDRCSAAHHGGADDRTVHRGMR